MSPVLTWFVACNVWFIVVLAVMMTGGEDYPSGSWLGAALVALIFGTITTLLLWLAVVEITVRLLTDLIGALL